MSALVAVMTREAKIRATNLLFIFWDLLYPLGYLLEQVTPSTTGHRACP